MIQLFSFTEFFVENYFFPEYKFFIQWNFILASMPLVILGLLMRLLAFYTAYKSFNHVIRVEKKDDHELVTHGIYSIDRHPSYTGSYIYYMAAELMLGNPLSFGLAAYCFHKFFVLRIQYEEHFLIKMFGNEYIKYKNEVPVHIPYVNQNLYHYNFIDETKKENEKEE